MLFSKITNSNMPKWLKWLLNITLAITCVYWIGYLCYKIIDLFRIFIHNLTEYKIFWVMFGVTLCLIILGIILLYKVYNINILENVLLFLKNKWNTLINLK